MNNESCSVALKASALDFERPWPGLLSFTETGNGFFFGRNQEIAELHRRVKNHTLTTLFGQSGYGKTSLVLAGLFPTLRAERFKPIRIRPDYESELSVVDQIKQHVAREFDGSADTKASLWECFHRIGNPLCSVQDGRTPCLVLTICDNYLTVQQDILETFVDRGQLRRLAEPTVLPSGKRIPGLKLDNPRQLALMHALVRFAHIAAGSTFTTAELYPHV